MKIKDFFERYFYNSVKMFVRQIAISIFGLMIAIATSGTLSIITSAFAALFYLFLIYETAFSTGSRDSTTLTIKPKLATGFYMSVIANTLNIICALVIVVATLIAPSGEGFAIISSSTAATIFSVAENMMNGMYTGLLTLKIGGAALNTVWLSYVVIILPALIVSTVGYIFGIKDIRATSILIPMTPEEEERRREKKRKKYDDNNGES